MYMPELLVRLKTRDERLADVDREIDRLRAWRKQQEADANAYFNERLSMLLDKRKKLLKEINEGKQ